MFSRLSRAPAILEVDLNGNQVEVGETFKTRVSIRPLKDIHVRDGCIEVWCQESYWEVLETDAYVGSYDPSVQQAEMIHKTSRKRKQPVTAVPFHAEHRFLRDARGVREGLYIEDVAVEIPSRGPPSAPGKVVRIDWKLTATLNVLGRRALKLERGLNVVTHRPARRYGGASSAHSVENFPDCAMSLFLRAGAASPADVLRGTLRIKPARDFGPSSVAVGLVREELAGMEPAVETVSEAALSRRVLFDAGVSQEFPFELPVPNPCCPTLSTQYSSVSWKVKGTVSGGGRPPSTVEVSVWVGTG